MTRVAAIDCGTNSTRLLVADVTADRLVDVTRRMEVTRLGQGVDRTGEFAAEALTRTLDVSADYAQQCLDLGVERIRFVATSATRDAANRDVFISGVRDILGVEPEVISGDEEAVLSYLGATSILAPESPSPRLVVDLGGGSTEVVLGSDQPLAVASMDVGCVRMTERHLADGACTPEQRAAIEADVNQALNAASVTVPFGEAAAVIGVAGTITTVTAVVLGLDRYEPEKINAATMTLADVYEAIDRLWDMSRDERAALGFMHPGRVDVIAAGALVWGTVLRRIERDTAATGHALTSTITSEHDILDGIALNLGR